MTDAQEDDWIDALRLLVVQHENQVEVLRQIIAQLAMLEEKVRALVAEAEAEAEADAQLMLDMMDFIEARRVQIGK